MNIRLIEALSPIKAAMLETSHKSTENLHDEIRCKPRCSGCCKRYLVISIAEAIIIIDFLRLRRKWASVLKEAEAQKDTAAIAKPMAWFKMGIPCPLLQNDLCLAYQIRPVICSTHFSFSDPKLCSVYTTQSRIYIPHDLYDLHDSFCSTLDAKISSSSPLLWRLPISLALLMGEKLSSRSSSNFDDLIGIADEFK